jgi:hypothetical protein
MKKAESRGKSFNIDFLLVFLFTGKIRALYLFTVRSKGEGWE